MRIHTIDAALAPSPLVVSQGDYRGAGSLAACDTVVWDAGELYAELVTSGLELSVGESTRMFGAARHWRREFGALLRRGGTIVLLLPEQAMVRAHHFEDLIDLNLLESLGDAAPRPEALAMHVDAGPATWRVGGQPFHDFFSATQTLWHPRSQLTHARGEIILQTATGDVLATYQTRDAGRLLLLPPLRDDRTTDDDHRWTDALSLLVARLADPSIVMNAAWLDAQDRAAHVAARQRIAACREAIARHEREIASAQAKLDRWAFYAQLVAGTGRGVSRALFEALSIITPGAQRDWLSETLTTVPYRDGVLVFRSVLHGETLDEALCVRIEDDVARIEKERGTIHRVLLVDCRENARPLDERASVYAPSLVDACARHGWQAMVSAEIFAAIGKANSSETSLDVLLASHADLNPIYSQVQRALVHRV
ncbi:hypothetical protein AAGS40_27875 (plasmid) [Paraburkholderia sp. PREW-6R]|uniref:hypothetical protein n=1 Tax=Paraburkholderia sp. PREW-6R TaxID=3141544 RepID=UPI0031F5D57B